MADQGREPTGQAIDLSSCDEEPIHAPGAIQPHGRLIVADADRLTVTHIGANLDPALLGAPLDTLFAPALVAEIRGEAAREAYAPGRILSAVPPGAATAWDLSVHRAGALLYLEFEPPAEPGEGQRLMLRTQAVLSALRGAGSTADLLDAAVIELKRLTGFDRTMVYRFDADGHGAIIAEAREDEQEAYLGLHYPAGDIPRQARHLYLLQRVRAIAAIDYAAVPVLAAPAAAAADALDMSYCNLRSVSPIHLEYMRNMGVSATFAMSLIRDGALWGMLICHHRTPRALSAQMRALCDLIGQILSVSIGEKEQAEQLRDRLARQHLLGAVETALEGAEDPLAALAAADGALLALAGADGALLRLGGESLLIGACPPAPAAGAIADAMLARSPGESLASDWLARDCPECPAPPASAAGALLAPLLDRAGDAILWFRGEARRQVRWGGDPNKPVEIDAAGRLTPRTSFAAWQQLVEGRSQPWSDVDRAAATELHRLVTAARLRQAEQRLALEQAANERLRATRSELERALEHRDLLLYEVNHRVKNSLQLVTSILALESGKIGDPAARASVMEARAKIAHVAQLHQRLYASGSHDRVDFAAFLRDMAASMLASAGRSRAVELAFSGPEEASLGIRIAAPLAMLAGELITNALKHAFPHGAGKLSIHFDVTDAEAILEVADDGIGMDPGFDLEKSEGVGIKILLGLTSQLRGELYLSDAGPGACFRLTIPLEEAPD